MMFDVLSTETKATSDTEKVAEMICVYERGKRYVEQNINPNKDLSSQDKQKNLDMYDFFIATLRMDLFGSSLTQVIFDKDSDRAWNRKWIPTFPVPAKDTYQISNMEFGDNTVVSVPYQKGKWHEVIKEYVNQNKEWESGEASTASFYPELKLIVIDKRRHHLAAESVHHNPKQTMDSVTVRPLSACFEFFTTDGAYWRNSKDPNLTEKVEDVRFALMYSLARDRWLLEQNR